MKLVKYTLLGLYANLFSVIFLLVYLLQGLVKHNIRNWLQWLLITAVAITGILNVIFAVKNAMNAFRLYKNREYNSLRKYMKVLKLGLIPYFIINFIICLLLFTLLFIVSRGIIMFTPIPIIFLLLTYLTVLFTSSYGIGFAAIINEEKRLKNRKLTGHVLLQLCFVLDVISTIILLVKYKAEQTN